MKNRFLASVFLLIFLSINVFANFASTYAYDEVKTDFEAQNTEKYQKDNFKKLEPQTLIQKQIINNVSQLTSSNDKSAINCGSVVNGTFTATVYEVNPNSGIVTCMLAKKNDLYNPIGIFEISYPKMKADFEKDLATAKSVNTTAVANAETQFTSLYTEKNNIYNSMNQQNTSDYLSIPDLLLSVILTDTDIIDAEATSLTGKLQLKQGFNSTAYSENGVTDTSSQFILADASSIFQNFASISDVSMMYLLALLIVFAVFGVINSGSKRVFAMNKNNANYSLMPYGVGMFAGLILFFPTTEEPLTNTAQNQNLTQQYSLYQNRFMHFSREGYYLTAEWAKDTAKVIIDNELNTMISKSGVGTAEQIVNSYASKVQAEKITNYTSSLLNECSTIIYEPSKMTTAEKDKNYYSSDINTVYPNSENYAYASSLFKSGTSSDYYNAIGAGGITKTGNGSSYPKISLSGCSKLYYETAKNKKLFEDLETSYNTAVANTSNNNSDKIEALKTILGFQYSLYRDYGFLSILGLPIMKLQSESISGLYSNPNNIIIQQLNDKIDGGGFIGSTIHSLASSVPMMLIPGISSIYTNVGKVYGDIIDGLDKSAWGWFKNAVGGGVATAVLKNVLGFSSSYILAKAVLTMLPIVALLIIGILRFIVIYIKILSFHFASLFIMPIIFILNNIESQKQFFVKILSTMLELPLFVLAVYLAMLANNLIHAVGEAFSKRIIIGMIENNETLHSAKSFELSDLLNMNFQVVDTIKIYLLDGLTNIAISLFAVVIIYKIIVNLHTAIFELVEIKATSTLDNTIDSMQNNISSNLGNKI